MNKEELVNKYINIVNKMAYSFCKTTGHDFEDLRSEGVVGLLRALNKFDESLGNQMSTLIHISVRNAMINYIKKHQPVSSVDFFDIECHHQPGYQRLEFLDSLNNLGTAARQMARIIFLSPTAILRISKESSACSVRKALKAKMKELGYTKKEIDAGISELKSVLNP